MLNCKDLKKSAREKLHLNRFFLLVMFVALSIEGGGTSFYSIFIFFALNSGKSPQVILIKIIFKIIFSLVLCFSISNIVHLIRDSIYLEMAKSEKKLDNFGRALRVNRRAYREGMPGMRVNSSDISSDSTWRLPYSSR